MRIRSWLVLALVVVLGVMSVACLAACGSEDTAATETTAATTATTAESSGETTTSASDAGDAAGGFEGQVAIGVINSMTGAMALNGAEAKWAMETAAADINAAGGVDISGKKMEVVLKFADDKSDATEAAAAMEKLIKVEGINLVLSTEGTPFNLAAATVAEKYGALYHMRNIFTQVARAQDFKWATCTFFSTNLVSEVPFNVSDMQAESERPTRWGILTQDDADGETFGGGMKAMAEKHGYEVVLYETFTPGTKDFASTILKFKENNVDAFLAFAMPADAITFVKQMKEQQFSPKLFFGWRGFWTTDFQTALLDDSNYVCYDGFWNQNLGYPGGEELGKKFEDAHDGRSSVSIGLPYATVQTLVMAIERAGSTDPAAVRAELVGGTFEGTTMGDVTYDEKGVADIIPCGLQWIDGARVIVFPDVGNELQWFTPWSDR